MPIKNANNAAKCIILTAKEKTNPNKWHHFSRANQPTKTVIETVDYKKSAIPVPSRQNIPSRLNKNS